jgi:hypothetical protein
LPAHSIDHFKRLTHICFIGEIARLQVKTGGVGSFVAELIPALLSHGAQVSVISYKQQTGAVETEEAEGFRIYWINTHHWATALIEAGPGYKQGAEANT